MALVRRASGEPSARLVRRGLLDDGQRPDDRARHALLADADIFSRALDLCAQ
jgi:hypothetical protein